MTMKSAFYPILGDKIFGWMGDAIDTVSVATTLFGVCTSLGLGVIQLNAGLNRMNESIGINQTSQAIIIWSITALATISVVSGVKVGIRRLSEINWLTAQFIAFYFLFMEDTFYILNVLTQVRLILLHFSSMCRIAAVLFQVLRCAVRAASVPGSHWAFELSRSLHLRSVHLPCSALQLHVIHASVRSCCAS